MQRTPVPLSPLRYSDWSQHAIIILGNLNCAISTESCRSPLIKTDPKLGNLATSEEGQVVQGGLLMEPFIKELGKCVASFNS